MQLKIGLRWTIMAWKNIRQKILRGYRKRSERMTLGCKAKVLKILALIKDEVNGSPTYYVINKLCDNWKYQCLRLKRF
jgi:tRNA G26 N,N-dimethylase Trm1